MQTDRQTDRETCRQTDRQTELLTSVMMVAFESDLNCVLTASIRTRWVWSLT